MRFRLRTCFIRAGLARRVLAALAVTAAVVPAGCGSGEKSAPASAAAPAADARTVTFTSDEIQHGGVKWAAVESMTRAPSVEVPGQLVPDEDRTIRVSAPAEGRLLTVRVNVGDRIVRGQLLATLRSEAASSARADSTKAMADLHASQTAATYARLSRARFERLLELKAASRQDLERARTEDEVAQAAVTHAQAEVERATKELGHLNVDASGDSALRSSIAGVVLTREAVSGAVVAPGAPLFTVTDPGTLWLQIAATEAIASALRTGTRVTFSVPAFVGVPFEAKVQNVGGALDPDTRTLPVRALVVNTDGRLRPEMFATVQVELGAARSGVAVPDAAVQLLDERPVVFVARPQSGAGGATFERRDVEIGAKQAGTTQIVRGLHAGDIVVTDGAFAVKSQFSRSKLPS